MRGLLISFTVCSVAFGCSWLKNSHPEVAPGQICWVFPGIGQICAEPEKIQALKARLGTADAGEP